MTDNRIETLRRYLESIYMFTDNEWLSGCVEYLTEDSGTTYTENEIRNLAKEQWLLNDLKDICPGSLPANLKGRQKISLNGKYVLQINSAEDIGTPAYQQYLKLQKINTENVDATTKFEDKIPCHRMIKLHLTDGVQDISGIEYKPMRNLTCDITPGCKVLIKGPVDCRRGVLLLTEHNVELLGGEVQEISISNSLAGVLSTKLGLSLNQVSESINNIVNQPRNSNIPVPHAEIPPRLKEETSVEATFGQSRPVARVTSIQVSNFNDDDIDLEQLDAIEAQFSQFPGKRSLNDVSTQPQPEKKIKVDVKMDFNNSTECPEDEDLFFEDEDYLMEMEAKFDAKEKEIGILNKGPTTISSEPYVFVQQIQNIRDSERAGRVFKVKGQILKLLSKLSVGKDGWSLKCTITDGTGNLDAEFTSDVLSKLVGYTPQEMNQIKKQMNQKAELKEKIVAALQKAKDTLQVLYCIIELTMLEIPKITCLTPFDSTHLEALKNRQKYCL